MIFISVASGGKLATIFRCHDLWPNHIKAEMSRKDSEAYRAGRGYIGAAYNLTTTITDHE